ALNPEKIIFGFDSFEGLPETWDRADSEVPQGTFAMRNDQLPIVLHNVRLVKGLFKNTLPKFKQTTLKNAPIAFLHIDVDIYSSTKDVLDNLQDHIVPGTIIVFDEFYNYEGYDRNEFKAFHEFLKKCKRKANYIAYNQYFEQVAIRIE
ncbi:MAG TPA: TylF/MycF/NovP-related O-methyltransferase, partial [Waddliaceae bacterium]